MSWPPEHKVLIARDTTGERWRHVARTPRRTNHRWTSLPTGNNESAARREEVNFDNLQKNTTNSGNAPYQDDERLLNKARDAVMGTRKPRNCRR